MLPSGSQWERAFVCEASACLPGVEEATADADRGTAIHTYLATVGTLGRARALEDVAAEWREACAAIDLHEYPQVDPASYAHEVAFAIDWRTGRCRELHRGGGRDYASVGQYESACTVDVCALARAEGHGVVVEWKSGFHAVPPPRKNRQCQIEALMFARAFALNYVRVGVGYVRDGRPWFAWDDFDALDLDVLESEFTRRAGVLIDAQRVYEETGRVFPSIGEHCARCPAFNACPPHHELAARLASDGPFLELETKRLLLTPETAPIAVRRLRQAKQLLGKIEGAVQAYADHRGGINMGDGTIWGERKTTVEKLDGAVTRDAIRSYLQALAQPPDVQHGIAEAAVSLATTKTKVEAAAKEIAKRCGLKTAPTARAILDEIRRRGGVNETTRRAYDFYPKEEEKR